MARAKPVAEFIDRCLGPTLAAQGFAASDIITAWTDIVGERLAAHTEPLRIAWPRGVRDERREPATLVVRVTGAFALELQHAAPIVVERVNTYFGWRCIGRLSLRQGPVRRPAAPRQAAAPPDPAQAAFVRQRVVGIGDESLRDALVRLGDAVLADTVPAETKIAPKKA
jgi:hypothetical protein